MTDCLIWSFDLVDVLLELQGGLQLPDGADVQVSDQWVGAGAGDPALDSPELDVTEDDGRVAAGGGGRGQHPGGEAPHGQAGQRLQGQDRGAEGVAQDISAHCPGWVYCMFISLHTGQHTVCSAGAGQDWRALAASSDKNCPGPGAASEVQQQTRGGAQLAGVCQVPAAHGQTGLRKCQAAKPQSDVSNVRTRTGPWSLTTAPRVWPTSPTLWTWTARGSWGPWWTAPAWPGSWGTRRQGSTPPRAGPAARWSPPSWRSSSVTRWRSWPPSIGPTCSSLTSAWGVSCPPAWTALCSDQAVRRN